ncbi:uncharacterized protein domain protein [Halorubrum sp. AJ67]|nr:uncharacterized protein domain protein [Halorubrum sp. AJ67]
MSRQLDRLRLAVVLNDAEIFQLREVRLDERGVDALAASLRRRALARLADRLARIASGPLPKPIPYLLAVGITLGVLWMGSRLAYGGTLTRALFGSN